MDNSTEVNKELTMDKPTPFLKRVSNLEQNVIEINRKLDSVIKSLRK